MFQGQLCFFSSQRLFTQLKPASSSQSFSDFVLKELAIAPAGVPLMTTGFVHSKAGIGWRFISPLQPRLERQRG